MMKSYGAVYWIWHGRLQNPTWPCFSAVNIVEPTTTTYRTGEHAYEGGGPRQQRDQEFGE